MTNVLTAHRKLTCRLSNTFRLTFEAVQMMLHNPSGKQDTKPFGKTVIVFTSTVDTAHVGLRQCDMLHSTIGAVFFTKNVRDITFQARKLCPQQHLDEIWCRLFNRKVFLKCDHPSLSHKFSLKCKTGLTFRKFCSRLHTGSQQWYF